MPDKIPLRVTISEASRLFGVHDKTIRRAIRGGDLRYIVVHGRYKLHFDSLMLWSQRRKIVREKRDSKGIGQWVERWKIRNILYSPRPPQEE
jgi:excisionase family DNA binding protein